MKLGGVLLFRLCFEKGVWLLVSSFSFDAATAIKIGGSQNETKLDFYSRISEGTFQPPGNLRGTCYCDCFCVIFGTKLGGVLLFRLCFEKGVWLLVSCFIRGSSSN